VRPFNLMHLQPLAPPGGPLAPRLGDGDRRGPQGIGPAVAAPDRLSLSGCAHRDDIDKPALQDYPAMFWLRDGFDHGLRSVFDLGHPAGTRFYAFESWLRCPAEARWTVCDAPAAVAHGRRLALARRCDDLLDFTENPDDADGYDMLFASGSLQRLPWTLDGRLAPMKRLPRRLVINAAAIHPQRSFTAPARDGTAGSAWRVQAEPDFVGALQALGYRQLDRWATPLEAGLQGQEDGHLDHLTGYCFDRW
jgi:putative methyltransferase (TIGR04325 family)